MTSIFELAPKDFEIVARWLSNPDVNRWLTSEWRNREVTPSLVAIAARNRRNSLHIVCWGEQPCGVVALADIDLMDKVAMVWYALGKPELSGKGIISEAVRALVRFAFEKQALQSLYAWIIEENVRSRRVLQKVGFREAGRLREATSSGGRQLDRVFFDLVPGDLV